MAGNDIKSAPGRNFLIVERSFTSHDSRIQELGLKEKDESIPALVTGTFLSLSYSLPALIC